MHAAEIIVQVVQRNRVEVILNFLRESIRQSREAAQLHTNREIRALNIVRAEKQNAPAVAEAWLSTCASIPDPHMLSSEIFLIR
jgi:hypothetical protein